MFELDPERTGAARRAAELALVRVCHHYGARPEFVLLGGLVPGLLCSDANLRHAGTTDVDVQVDLELTGGSVHAARLEQALRNADFHADAEHKWRWKSSPVDGPVAVIKFELLADLDSHPQGSTVQFDDCDELGAVNLRGTGYASRDVDVRTISANDHGVRRTVDVNVAGLAGFLLAKTAAAHGRHKPKDYYDIAFVLLHHNEVSNSPAELVLSRFGSPADMQTSLLDLQANFENDSTIGVHSYVAQITQDHPELDAVTAGADSILAVREFTSAILDSK